VACNNARREHELIVRNDSLSIALSQNKVALEQVMQTIADIQDGFRAINEAEGRVAIQIGQEGITDSQRMREDILFIQQRMESNRKQIESLHKELLKSGEETASLRKVLSNLQQELNDKVSSIAALQNELAQKNVRIAELDSAVALLTGDVNALQKVTETQLGVIERQELQLNTAWYVYGTARELKEQYILKGGKLFSTTDFNKNYFTEIDIRTDKIFPLYANHAKLLTTHPDGSYEFTRDESKQLTLTILDPTAFWSVSRYMVIQIR
jgi:chromosome segregation ATPase